MAFIDNFRTQCAIIGKQPTVVTREIGISNGAYSGWVNGGEPQNAMKKKIAEYFGITVAELDGENPAEKDGEMIELLQACKDSPALRMMFQTFKNVKSSDILKVIADYQKMRGE